jgi:hypothetical protein
MVAPAQRTAELARGGGQPGQCGERVAQAVGSAAGGDLRAVLAHTHPHACQVRAAQLEEAGAEHEETAGRVVRDGVDDADVPAGDPAVDDLQRGHHLTDGCAHRGGTQVVPVQVIGEHHRHLGLDPRLQQPGGVDHAAVRHHHVVEEHPEVGLVDPQLGLHPRVGQADLVADDAPPALEREGRQQPLYGVAAADVGREQTADGGTRDSGDLRLAQPVRRGHHGRVSDGSSQGDCVAADHAAPPAAFAQTRTSPPVRS